MQPETIAIDDIFLSWCGRCGKQTAHRYTGYMLKCLEDTMTEAEFKLLKSIAKAATGSVILAPGLMDAINLLADSQVDGTDPGDREALVKMALEAVKK